MVPEFVERSFFIANMSYTIPTKLLCKVTKKFINNQIYFKSIRSASQLFQEKTPQEFSLLITLRIIL